MKPCVVTFAKGQKRYLDAVERLKESFAAYDIPVLAFTDESQIQGCPSHGDVPYGFKPFAMYHAMEQGYDTILWCDSVVYCKADPTPVFRYIWLHGVMLFDNIGHSLGQWTSDYCLMHYGIDREQSFDIQMIMACCMGVNLNASAKIPGMTGWNFFKAYMKATEHELSPYFGSWTNDKHQVSQDDRVKGHRHDQSVASIIAHEQGIELLTGHETFFTYEDHPGMQPVADSVVLFSK